MLYHKYVLGFFLVVLSNNVFADTITPTEFRKLWETDNKRNMLLRYQKHGWEPRALLQIDYGPAVDFQTASGQQSGEIDRGSFVFVRKNFHLHYDQFQIKGENYDIAYGEKEMAFTTGALFEKFRFDLAAKINLEPGTTTVNGEEVFATTNNTTDEGISEYLFNVSLLDINLSTLFNKEKQFDSFALKLPTWDIGDHRLELLLTSFKKSLSVDVEARQEAVLSYAHALLGGEMESEIGVIHLQQAAKNKLSRVGLGYSKEFANRSRFYSKLFFTDDFDDGKKYNGYKVSYALFDGMDYYRFTLQKNALSDVETMIIRDEQIVSFAMIFSLDRKRK